MYKQIKAVTDSYIVDDSYLNYPLCKKLDEICRAHGYRLYDCSISYYGKRLQLSFVKDDDTFLPDVTYRNRGDVGFYIQTTAFGELSTGEYETFLQDVNEAYEFVKEMEEAIDEIGVVPGETVAIEAEPEFE